MRILIAAWLYAAFYALAFVSSPTDLAATHIKSQAPCNIANGFCVRFNSNSATPFIVRRFDFTAPSAGTALVQFHGDMICSQFTGSTLLVMLHTQIMTAPNQMPDQQGPGGMRLGGKITSTENFITYNLASTRVFNFPRTGKQSFYFAVDNEAGVFSNGVDCDFYSVSFNVVFSP